MLPRSLFPTHALGLSALLAASLAQAHPALAKKHDCVGCHAQAVRMVGPSFQEIAAKYAGQADAVANLSASIRAGGAGRWGEVPMPPQAKLPAADLKRLATWIAQGAK